MKQKGVQVNKFTIVISYMNNVVETIIKGNKNCSMYLYSQINEGLQYNCQIFLDKILDHTTAYIYNVM